MQLLCWVHYGCTAHADVCADAPPHAGCTYVLCLSDNSIHALVRVQIKGLEHVVKSSGMSQAVADDMQLMLGLHAKCALATAALFAVV
jgi:hypothetical protein